ncbi:serine hydrolase [Crocinitomix catalasitica]|uniref:serine hydrolase n=1 Tax=Crocinitomix catalasitica TaxID=184607 RepID=UPI000480E2FE|nr:serine hydrolase [Crocinitomix catalasitica]
MTKVFQTFNFKQVFLFISISIMNLSLNAQMNLTYADTLEATLSSFAYDSDMQGVASAVIFPDGSTWSSAYGHYGDEELHTDLIYDIGSNTKSMISTIILMLEEEGELNISDSLYSFIDFIPNVPYGISLKRLLEQRSGIANYTEHPDFFDTILDDEDFFWHPDSILSNFVSEPEFPVGLYFHYSNTNYLLLGKVIEEVEGLPLNEVLYNRLFEPLDLTNTYLEGYDAYDMTHTGAFFGPGDYEIAAGVALYSSAWSAGAVVSTPENFAGWCHQLFRGDILSESSMIKMRTGTYLGVGSIYGLGIEEERYNGRKYLMHGGNTFQNSDMHYSLESDFSVVSMNLDAGFSDETRALQHALIDVLEFAIEHFAKIEEEKKVLSIELFPNPSNNAISLNLTSHATSNNLLVKVYNTIGKVVYIQPITNQQTILNKSDIGQGLFIVEISSESKILATERIIFYD